MLEDHQGPKEQGSAAGQDFDEIYEKYWPKVYRYLTRMIGAEDAEDATQEVFMKVANSLDAFRNESQLSTWIYRIATNSAIDRMRKLDFRQNKLRQELQPEFTGETSADKERSGRSGKKAKKTSLLESKVIHREMNDCIRGIIDALPEKYRTIIILSEMEGLKNKELAAVLGISLEAAKVRVHRAKAQLRQMLQHHCNFYWDERNELACDRKAPAEGIDGPREGES